MEYNGRKMVMQEVKKIISLILMSIVHLMLQIGVISLFIYLIHSMINRGKRIIKLETEVDRLKIKLIGLEKIKKLE